MAALGKIIVFGATGNTGLTILERGVKDGLTLTAFVRTPSRIPEKLHKDINIVKGDVLSKKDVEDAIQGHDIVLSALGTGWALGKTTLISEGCKNIVAGMKKHKVRKLAVVGVRRYSSFLIRTSYFLIRTMINCTDLLHKSLIAGEWKPWVIKQLIDDHQRQIDFLKSEKDFIDWLALMPPSLWKSSHVSSRYVVEKNQSSGCWWVTTGEMADFMLKCFKDDELLHKYRHCLVGISSGPALVSDTGIKILSVCSVLAIGLFVAYYYGLIMK